MKTRRLLFVGATAVFAALVFAVPVLAALDTVSGHAYGESVDVTTLALVHITSGPLPSTGELTSNGSNSPLDNSAVSACVPAITCTTLSTGALTVHTDGTPASGVHSTASVLNVSALAGLVTGSVVASQCAVDPANGATSGSSTLTSVFVNGVLVASNPGPNTSLVLVDAGSLVIGSVILNEQIYNSGTNTLTVNAIHIHLVSGSLGTGDIIISQSQCDALPAGPAPVIPESPLAILLPLSALVVVGGVLLVTLRRNATIVAR